MIDINNLKMNGYFVAAIDGAENTKIDSFLHQIAVAFKFPDYYGNNINAFWDCIRDLSWLNESNYVLIIRNHDLFLKDEKKEIKKEVLDIIDKIVKDWKNVPNYEGEDEYRNKADFKVIYD